MLQGGKFIGSWPLTAADAWKLRSPPTARTQPRQVTDSTQNCALPPPCEPWETVTTGQLCAIEGHSPLTAIRQATGKFGADKSYR